MSIDFFRHVHALKSPTWRVSVQTKLQPRRWQAHVSVDRLVGAAATVQVFSSIHHDRLDYFVLVAMSSPLLRLHPQWLARSSSRRPASPRRVRYLTQGPEPAKSSRSPHAQFYSDLVPGMVPVALLGSAVYLVSDCLLHVFMCISFCSSRA